jgi:hypothetical protein
MVVDVEDYQLHTQLSGRSVGTGNRIRTSTNHMKKENTATEFMAPPLNESET